MMSEKEQVGRKKEEGKTRVLPWSPRKGVLRVGG